MTDLVLEDINIIEELNEIDFNQETIDEFNKIKNDIKESKNNIINLKKNDDKVKKELELMIKKNLLINHIEGKFSKLEQKMRLIELKNNRYKSCYNGFQIGIILLSTTMTMVESVKAIILDPCDEEQKEISNYFQLSPIIFGSVITCAASILKFKKYQEKMENIVKLVEKGNAIIGLLKKIREELTFCTELEDYHSIETRFKSDAYDDYIANLQELERLLKDSDYDSYLHLIHNTDFKVHVLEQRRKTFFDNYLPDTNLNIDLSRKKKSCCLC